MSGVPRTPVRPGQLWRNAPATPLMTTITTPARVPSTPIAPPIQTPVQSSTTTTSTMEVDTSPTNTGVIPLPPALVEISPSGTCVAGLGYVLVERSSLIIFQQANDRIISRLPYTEKIHPKLTTFTKSGHVIGLVACTPSGCVSYWPDVNAPDLVSTFTILPKSKSSFCVLRFLETSCFLGSTDGSVSKVLLDRKSAVPMETKIWSWSSLVPPIPVLSRATGVETRLEVKSMVSIDTTDSTQLLVVLTSCYVRVWKLQPQIEFLSDIDLLLKLKSNHEANVTVTLHHLSVFPQSNAHVLYCLYEVETQAHKHMFHVAVLEFSGAVKFIVSLDLPNCEPEISEGSEVGMFIDETGNLYIHTPQEVFVFKGDHMHRSISFRRRSVFKSLCGYLYQGSCFFLTPSGIIPSSMLSSADNQSQSTLPEGLVAAPLALLPRTTIRPTEIPSIPASQRSDDEFTEILLRAIASEDESFLVPALDVLERAAISCSQKIADTSAPTATIAWASSQVEDSAPVLFPLTHIERKVKQHNFLLNLLFRRSGTVPGIIQLHNQKLRAAYQLRILHNDLENKKETAAIKYLVNSIHSVTQNWTNLRRGIPLQEIFYTQTTKIDEILPYIAKNLSPVTELQSAIIGTANKIFVHMLLEFRAMSLPQVKPVALLHDPNIVHALELLCECNGRFLTKASLEKSNEITQYEIFKHYYKLCDFLLTALRDSMLPLNTNHTFEEHRYNMIQTLYASKQVEMAKKLAVDFQEFGLLLQMCTSDMEIDSYYHTFGAAFTEFYLKNLLDSTTGLRAKLIAFGERHPTVLSGFLERHPQLSWVHDIYLNKFDSAARTLSMLSSTEDKFFTRAQSLSSLAFLSAIASGSGTQEVLTERLLLLRLQKQYCPQLSVPITASALVSEVLDQQAKRRDKALFLDALSLWSNSTTLTDQQSRQEMIGGIWSAVLANDDWERFTLEYANLTENARGEFVRNSSLAYVLDLIKNIPESEALVALREAIRVCEWSNATLLAFHSILCLMAELLNTPDPACVHTLRTLLTSDS
ncbi:nuclear pore complex protein Nup133 [Pelomyxa schiedti]|nr:nuclear pore complex protein Nup133 [Pelomyxa schiedti]